MQLVSYRERGRDPRVGRLTGETEVVPLAAPSMLAWLAGEGHEDAGEPLEMEDVTLLAPVPTPPSVRDFFSFEGHVEAGWRLRGGDIPPAWYEAPVFYFSNPASILGPGEPVPRPQATRMLDFELEIAAVIGGDGRIAGFTIMNDWSARDVQRREMTVGLGPAKGKDFATSMGPWLVTADEVPVADGRLDLDALVTVNGVQLASTTAREQHFTWDELVAQAARDTPGLRPGDILGSGTLNRGCLLELGPLDGGRFLEPGDRVELTVDWLGTLAAEVVEPGAG